MLFSPKKESFCGKISREKLEFVFSIIFFVALSYLFLHANLLKNEIVAPMDLLFQYPGWKESGLSAPLFNAERSDIVNSLLPSWTSARDSILNGQVPLWNPTRAGGSPGITYLYNALFSTGFLLFLIFGGGLGFTLALLSRLTIAGLGAYKLCRTRTGVIPALLGGITYMMCGFNACWLMWPHVEASQWVPWVLWAVIRLEEKPTGKRVVTLSFFIAMLIFGGFLSVAAYGLLLAGFLAIWLIAIRLIKQDKTDLLKKCIFIALGIMFGFLLTSIQLIPFIEWLKQFDTTWRHGGSCLNVFNLDTLWEPFKYVHDFGSGRLAPKVEWSGYVGKTPVVLAIISVFSIFKKKGKELLTPLSPLFWGTATLITIMVAFNFPVFAEFVYKFPVFNNNPSNRLLVLVGLEFAVLGALGLQFLLDNIPVNLSTVESKEDLKKAKLKKGLLLFLALIIVASHTVDISRLGAAGNAVVSSDMFYPETPTLQYVSENLKPGESVLAATDSYSLSGSVSAYGISEWFAHSYFKNTEKDILSRVVADAWQSPTAAAIQFEKINLSSGIADKLGIRYILTSADSYISQPQNDVVAPPLNSNVLGQVFKINNEVLVHGITVYTATSGHKTSGTAVNLNLFDSKGKLLATSHLDAHNIEDNSWVNFNFEKPVLLQPGTYRFEANSINKKSYPVTFWTMTGNDSFKDGYMTVNGKQAKGDLSFKVLGVQEASSKRWKVFNVGDRVTIYENIDCPPGAYTIQSKDFSGDPETTPYDFSGVKLLDFSSGAKTYRVETNSSGWFVTTSRLWPGWQATVNGKPVEIVPYMNILPAVKIEPGTSVVQYKYQPENFYIGCIVSFAAVLVLLLIGFWKRTGPKGDNK